MDAQTFSYLLNDARKALEARRLLSALDSMKGMVAYARIPDYADELDNLYAAYMSLLDFMEQGASDPAREEMYRQFRAKARTLCRKLEREGLRLDGHSFYAETWQRLSNRLGDSFAWKNLLSPVVPHDELFDALWTSGQWTAAEAEAVGAWMRQLEVSDFLKCVAVSAVTLSAMQIFDAAKLQMLLQAAETVSVKVRVRAWVGIAFVLVYHADEASNEIFLSELLEKLTASPSGNDMLKALQVQLFLTLETKRIEHRLREEIMPQVVKRIHDLKIDRTLGFDELNAGLDDGMPNPEWNGNGAADELASKMRELVELQKRGADIYMGTFKIMKQRFPFFQKAVNWLCPFTVDHPDLTAGSKGFLLPLLHKAVGLCDSDKYSMCLMNERISGAQLDMIKSKLGGDLVDWESFMKDESKVDEALSPEEELRSYIQDFYRFCNLYSRRKAFRNPFSENLFLPDYAPFESLLADSAWMEQLAGYAFDEKSYHLAQNIYQRVGGKLSADGWQRLAFCYQKDRNYPEAVRAYGRANLLRPSSFWAMSQEARCLRAIGSYEEALKKYAEIEKLAPEDAGVALHQAQCHIHLGQYEEAFHYLFKADYLASDSANTARALAWCSLLTGKWGQAERYYGKVMQQSPVGEDFLNAGHTAWLMGNVKEAVRRYVKALEQDGEAKEDFLKADEGLLLANGVSPDDLRLMTDLVLRKIHSNQESH